jgi:hypothetical protein
LPVVVRKSICASSEQLLDDAYITREEDFRMLSAFLRQFRMIFVLANQHLLMVHIDMVRHCRDMLRLDHQVY